MFKYSFRIFDKEDNLILSAIVPADHIFDWISKYQNEGVIKAYIINDQEGDN